MREKYNLLIVEKDSQIGEGIKKFLGDEGDFEIVGVLDSEKEVEEICKSKKVHLVLVETSVEESSKEGRTLATTLGKLYGVPVIFIVSSKEKEHIKRFALDFYGYIVKPLSRDQVLNTIYLAIQKAKLEKNLLEMQKLRALSIFAGGIAHDFNNILGAIIGYSELINLKAKSNKDISKYIDLILKACMRGKQLIDHLLTFSTQKENVKKYKFPFHIILKETIKFIKSNLSSEISIYEDIIKDRDLIYADPAKIHQLCLNLLTKVCEAVEGEKQGEIEVFLKRIECPANLADSVASTECLCLEIKISGSRIKQEVVNKIFKPFPSTKKDNTDLGLSVVHEIVTELGGEIMVNSEEGVFATIKIIFPVAEEDTIL